MNQCFNRRLALLDLTITPVSIKYHTEVNMRKYLNLFMLKINYENIFCSSQNSNNNNIKRERESNEYYAEESYDYSDEEEFESKRLKTEV